MSDRGAFDRQPTLAGGGVSIRPLRQEDREPLHRVAADPLVWAQHPARDRWRRPVFDQFFDEAMASGGALYFADTASGEAIGTSRYDLRRAGPGEVEIGWTVIARDRWGGPTNAVVKRLMIDHALARFDAVVFMVADTNMRSRRALEKIGAARTDRVVPVVSAGVTVPHIVYRIDAGARARRPLGGLRGGGPARAPH